jgi:ATP-dependent Clp protease adapter protein ClpS
MSRQPSERPDSHRWLDEHSCVSRPSPDQTQPRQLPRVKLVLLRDAINDLMFIVRTIMELTRLCRAEATHKMWESHHCGRSVLLVTYRERAELYVEQFASRNLATTLEPAG